MPLWIQLVGLTGLIGTISSILFLICIKNQISLKTLTFLIKVKLVHRLYREKRVMSTKFRLDQDIELGLINPDLSPIKCSICGSTQFHNKTVSTAGDNVVAEYEVYCHNKHMVAYWAYGDYLP